MKKYIYKLPKGAIQRVAEKLHMSPSTVSKVARGERRNAYIEEELAKAAKDHQARLKRIERIKTLLNARKNTPQ